MDALNDALKFDTNPKTRIRIAALSYFINFGTHPKQITSMLKHSIRTMQNWIKRYMEEGIAGHAERPGSGRPPMVPKITLNDFMGQNEVPITPQQLWQKIDQDLDCKYTAAYTRDLLHKHGY